MNNSAIVSCMASTSVGAGTTVASSPSSPQRAGEPKRAFADTAPMVKVRNEQRARTADASERASDCDGTNEPTVACEAQGNEPPVRQKEQKTEVEDRPEEVSVQTTDDSAEVAAEAPSAGQDEAPVTAPAAEPVADAAETVAEPVSVEIVDASTNEATDGTAAPQPSAEATVVSQDAVLAAAKVAEPVSVDVKTMTEASQTPVAAGETVPDASGMPQQAAGVSTGEASVSATEVAGTEQASSDTASQGADVAATGPDGLPGSSGAAAAVQESAGSTAPVVAEAAPAVQAASEQQVAGQTAERDVRQEGAVASSPQVEVATDSASGSDGEQASDDDMAKVSAEAQAESAVAQGETKTSSAANTSETSKAESEVQVDAHGTQTQVSESTSTRSVDTANAEGLVGRSPVQNVGDQILESVHASLSRGDRQVQVRLDPPELGSVTVRFQEQDGQITGILEVSKDQTRHEIEQALPQVMRGMQESGLLIRRLDVVIADQPEGDLDLDRETLFQDAWAQQGESDQQDTQAGRSPSPPWARWATEQDGVLEQGGSSPMAVAAQDRIDILL